MQLEINGRRYETDADASCPLLWVLRDHLGLTGTKFACGSGLCGACTVHVNGRAVRSCITPLAAVEHDRITTIEGVSGETSRRVVAAWIDEQVPQCGYCQPGMIMAVSALLEENPTPTDAQIDAGITNLCRCGTQPRIRRAIHRAVRGDSEPIAAEARPWRS